MAAPEHKKHRTTEPLIHIVSHTWLFPPTWKRESPGVTGPIGKESFGLPSRRAVAFYSQAVPRAPWKSVNHPLPSEQWKPLPVLGALLISEPASAATAAPATPHLHLLRGTLLFFLHSFCFQTARHFLILNHLVRGNHPYHHHYLQCGLQSRPAHLVEAQWAFYHQS